MEEKKASISIKLYNNIMRIYSMMKLYKTENIKVNDENKLQEIHSKLLISLSVFFFKSI